MRQNNSSVFRSGSVHQHRANAGKSHVMLVSIVALVVSITALAVAVWSMYSPRQNQGTTERQLKAEEATPASHTAHAAQVKENEASTSHGFQASGRIAIPQPGETFTQPIASARLEPRHHSQSAQPAPTEAVSWRDAPQYVGHEITVSGRVEQTNNIGQICFLNFTNDPRGGEHFYIVIFKEAFNTFPESPEKYFLNQTVRVKGKVQLHRNRPQIQVRSSAQIELAQ